MSENKDRELYESEFPHKKDSTKGKSYIDPIQYKGDVLSQVWVDSRVLATLALWMESQGLYPRFMSDLVREPLTTLVNSLVKNGEVEMVESTSEARDMLTLRFRTNLNRGGRGGKNVLHNKVLTTQREEVADAIRQRDEITSQVRPGRGKHSRIDSELVRQAIEQYKEIEKLEKQQKAHEEEKGGEDILSMTTRV